MSLLDAVLERVPVERPTLRAYAAGVVRRRPRSRRYQLNGRVGNLWVIVSHLESFDGSPMYLSKATKGNAYGGVPDWTASPREAHQFNSRQAANQFYKRVDFPSTYHAFPINLARYGFA